MPKQLIAATLTVAFIALASAGTNWAYAQGGDETGLLERPDADIYVSKMDAHSDSQSGIAQALKLSADQKLLWAPVEEALTSLKEQRRAYRSAMIASEQSDQVEQLRRRAELTTQRADALKKLVDAVQPLWATFSEEQKRQLTQSLSMAPSRSGQDQRMGRRDEDGVNMKQRHTRNAWRYNDEDRADRNGRDQDESGWRDRRDRMMSRGAHDYEDGHDDIRNDCFHNYPHSGWHDDYLPPRDRHERNRYQGRSADHRDDCRCYPRD